MTEEKRRKQLETDLEELEVSYRIAQKTFETCSHYTAKKNIHDAMLPLAWAIRCLKEALGD